MINVKKTIRKEQGLCLIVTELDAKAACIETEYEKEYVNIHLEHKLQKLSDDVDNDMRTKHLKDFLTEFVFTHYVDMVAIIDYVYNMKRTIKTITNCPSHSKFLFVTEFKNCQPDTDDQPDNSENDQPDNGKGTSFNLSFKTDLLNKKNLSFIEELLFHGLNSLYDGTNIGGRILILKPKEVKVYLKEKKTPEGIKEFLYTDIFFYKSNK